MGGGPVDLIAGGWAVGSRSLSCPPPALSVLLAVKASASRSCSSHSYHQYLAHSLLWSTCWHHSLWGPAHVRPPGSPLTSSPWPFPSPTSVCPGVSALLTSLPASVLTSHYTKKIASTWPQPLIFTSPKWYLPLHSDPLLFLSLHYSGESALSSCPGPALSPLFSILRVSVVGPHVFSPSSSSAPTSTQTCLLTNPKSHLALPCFPPLFIANFLEKLSTSALIHSKKDYYETFQAYKKCHTYPSVFLLALSDESFCLICFMSFIFHRKILQMQMNPFCISPLIHIPSSLEMTSFECGVWFLCIFLYFFLRMHIPINILFYTIWNLIWMASFSSLKSGLHPYTRTCLLLSRSLLPSMLLNPGNPLTPFSSSQQPECLEILSCGIYEPGILS